MIADVAVDVGVDEILAGTGEALQGGGEFGPVVRAVDIQKRKLIAGLGRGPAQGIVSGLAVRENKGRDA